MSVNNTKTFHLLFPRCCFGWGAYGGHGGCSTAAALPKMKSTVPLATAVPSRAGHAGGEVELFKLDCRDNLWVPSYCSDDFWFSQLLSGVFVVVEELFALELKAYNSDLRLCAENQEKA